MAPRVTGLARSSASARVSADAMVIDRADPDGIPLDLAPLISPYRKRGRLSIRVENLPARSRLSRGRNNGDRSWSLMSDELDGLTFLPPKGTSGSQTLAVRIIDLNDANGATLAMIDYPVGFSGGPEPVVRRSTNETPVRDEALTLRTELAKVKHLASVRDNELADLRKRIEHEEERIKERVEAELASARGGWEAEAQDRLARAAAEAAANLEKSRKAWLAERNQALADTELRIQERLAWARNNWKSETEAALLKAENAWRQAEAARMAAAEAEWRKRSAQPLAEALARCERAEAAAAKLHSGSEQLTQALAEARAEQESLKAELASAQSARTRSSDAAQKQLREQLASIRSELASREAELQQVRTAAEEERARLQQEAIAYLETAEKVWRSGEAERRGQLYEQLKAIQSALAERDQRIEQLRIEASEERERLQRESAAALISAETAWKASETARLTLAEAEWRERAHESLLRAERAETALAQATAQLDQVTSSLSTVQTGNEILEELQSKAARAEAALQGANARAAQLEDALAKAQEEAQASMRRGEEAEIARLRAETSNLQAELAARNAEIAAAQAAIERERSRARREVEGALAKVEQATSVAESDRIALAKEEWHRQSAASLADAIARYERAETEAARARAETEALRHEFAATQAAVAALESDLAVTRAEAQQARNRWASEAQVIRHVPQPHFEEEEREVLFRKRLVRDVVLVAAVAAVAIVFYPRVQPMIPQNWQPQGWSPGNVQLSTAMQSFFRMVGASDSSAPSPQEHPAVIGVSAANLRAGPSTDMGVIATLPRDSKVTQVDRRGDWVLVRMDGREGEPAREGWIFNSSLKNSGPLEKPGNSKPEAQN